MTIKRAWSLSLLFMLSATACTTDSPSTTTDRPTPQAILAPPPLPTKPPNPTPALRVAPMANRIVLPEGVQLSDIRVAGRDLIVALPDGTQTIIPEGAVFVPRLVIGDVEIPPENLYALLIGPEPKPAAGPPKVSTRLFVPTRFSDFEAYGAVAMIIFPQVPATSEQTNRHRRICHAYLTTLPDATMTREQVPELRQMVTLWPRRDIKKPLSLHTSTQAAVAAQCERAVKNYDFVTAAVWTALIPKQAGVNRTRRGPFLIAWAPASAIGRAKSDLLLFDLSDFEQTSAIQRAFRIWKAEIENDPTLWNRGWNMNRWKAHTAAKLDRYGKQISGAIKMVPWLKG